MSDESLFHEARPLGPAEREAFLGAQCANLEERRRVEELLAAHDASGGVLDQPGATGEYTPQNGTRQNGATLVEHPGLVIGPYKLLQKLGEGGMGAVWAAEQSAPVKRRVALKLIKAGMDSNQVLRRFEAERQALALMEHPNIAKVLDAGATPQGRPYFAMELIKGIPITKYCDQEHLSPRERLELFIPVCQAVQHAHQKGVIHRDLKPSNVLIALYDGKPVPKVIDFGVAKATSQKLTERTMYTEVGQIVGTLEYMAPEQAELNNLDIDTRADVYSLGVILYELLAGSPPFSAKQLRGAAFSEMLRMIREVEPQRPSTRLSSSDELPSIAANRKLEPNRLTRVVHGDLDWIVMKALEKDRARRYETANGFSMDIQRYLADQPVAAGPPGAGYRLKKFVRRNKGRVIAAAAVVLALMSGVAAVVAVQARANRELKGKNDELAAKNAELAEEQAKVQARFELAQKAIETFHTGVSEDMLLKNEQFKDLRTKLLRTAADFYGRLEKLLEGQVDAGSRKALGASYFKLAELINQIGAKPEALAVHRKALAVRRTLAKAEAADVRTRLEVAHSLLRIGRSLSDAGDAAGASQAIEEAIKVAEELSRTNATGDVQIALGNGYTIRALMLQNAGKVNEGLDAYRIAASDLQKAMDADPADKEGPGMLGHTLNDWGVFLYHTGKLAEALSIYEKSRVIRQQLADDNPADTRFQTDLATTHYNIGLVFFKTGKLKEALTAYERSREIQKALVRVNPAVHEFQSSLSLSDVGIGLLLAKMGKLDEALAALEQARGVQQKLVEANPKVTRYVFLLARTNYSIAYTLNESGKSAMAIASYEHARSLQQSLVDASPAVPEYQSDLGRTLLSIGNIQRETGRSDEAIATFQQATAILQKLTDANPVFPQYQSDLGSCHFNLGLILAATGRSADAMAAHQRALEIRQKLADANPSIPDFQRSLAWSHLKVAWQLAQTGRSVNALAFYEKALAIRQRLAEANPTVISFQRDLAAAYCSIGWLHAQTGRSAEAMAFYEKALAIQQRLVEKNPTVTVHQRDLVVCYNDRSDLLRMRQRYAEAREGYDRALAVGEPLVKKVPTDTWFQTGPAFSLRGRGMARLGLGDFAGAGADLQRSLTIWNALPRRTGEQWFETACCHAALAGIASRAGSGLNAADAKAEADEAVQLLKKAVEMGYRGPADYRTKDLDPLRAREDFKALLADLEKRVKDK